MREKHGDRECLDDHRIAEIVREELKKLLAEQSQFTSHCEAEAAVPPLAVSLADAWIILAMTVGGVTLGVFVSCVLLKRRRDSADDANETLPGEDVSEQELEGKRQLQNRKY